jgi:hypothetical protein
MFARSAVIPLMLLAGAVSAGACGFGQEGPEAPQAALAHRPTDMLLVKGRVQVEAPREALRLGEANAINVRVEGPALLRLSTHQERENTIVEDSDQAATLEKRADGSTYVELKPMAPGQIGIVFFAVFADGGYERDTVQAEVKATAPPETVEISGPAAFRGVVHMNLSRVGRGAIIGLKASYAGLSKPVFLRTSDAKMQVQFDEGEPAIRFDAATGKIEALRIGHALIAANVDGTTGSICISVEEGQYYQPADCSELEPGGSRVAATAPGADAPGALRGSKLPYTATDGRLGRFVADDRVTITPPAEGLELAREAQFTLEAHGGAIARVECGECTRWTGQRQGPDVPWTLGTDGRGTVSVFPSSLEGPPPYTGNPEFSFEILFTDGGVAVKTVTAKVTLGTVQARACPTGGMPLNEPIRLAAPENGAKTFPNDSPIHDFACYDGIQHAVMVSPQSLQYTVETEGEQPVVQLDAAAGKVTAVAPGEALVMEKAAGQQWAQCFIVAPREQSRDLSNCRALRAKYGAPLPAIEAKVEAPNVIVTEEAAAAQADGARMGVMGRIAVPGPPDLDAITYGTLSPDARDRFAADDRLEISLRGVHAVLGAVTRVPIQLHGPEPLALGIAQERTLRYTGAAPRTIEEAGWEEEQGAGTIYREADGTLAIHVTPLRPGRSKFTVDVLFADGGVATRTVELPVELPAAAGVHLENALEDVRPDLPAIPATTVHLGLSPPGNVRLLFPTVSLDGRQRPIALAPGDVTFALQQAADPVIRLDAAAGTVTAVRAGHALVRMRFDGAESTTCVVVQASATPGDPSNCEELR